MSVPPHILAASLAALGLHDPSVPVALLVGDSLVDRALRPADDADRRVLFEHELLLADLSVSFREAGDPRLLRLDIEPGDFTEMTLMQPALGVNLRITTREDDTFDAAAGLTCIKLHRPADGTTVRTAWFTL